MGRPFLGRWASSPSFSVAAPATYPVALRARMRRCRLPTASPAKQREEEQVRAIGLGRPPRLLRGGDLRGRRGPLRGPDRDHAGAVELFAAKPRSRGPGGARGDRQRLGDRADPRAARRARSSSSAPSDTGIRQARAKTDRLDARTLARLLATGELDAVWMPDEPTCEDAPAPAAPRPAGLGPLTRQEPDPRGADALPGRRAAVQRPLRGQGPAPGSPSSELPEEERETVDSALRQVDFLDREIDEVERLIASDALGSRGDQAADDRPGRERDRRRHLPGGDRRHPPLREPAQAGRLPRARPAGAPVGLGPGRPRADLQAGLDAGPPRAGRGELVDGPPARADARLLRAGPGPPRPPGRDRRLRAQARLPVLVPAQPLGGLRLRAAVADAEEAAPARACRRRPKQARDEERPDGRERGDAQGRARARPAGRGRLPAHASPTGRRPQGKRKGAGATPGRASRGPSSGQAARQVQAPGPAL